MLLSLEKYEDLQTFGFKIYETVSEIVIDCKKEKNDKSIYESEII